MKLVKQIKNKAMKRKKNLPVLELCWILLFVLLSFIKTIARQTEFMEGPELKPFIHFHNGGNHSSWKGPNAPDRIFNNTDIIKQDGVQPKM